MSSISDGYGVMGAAAKGYAPQTTAQLSAVKSSPLDERIASLGGNIASLESEVEALRRQLEPVSVSGLKDAQNSSMAAPAPIESAVEQAIRGFDGRVATLWQIVSALRAQLRV